jgi:hypothetical protein
MGGVAPEVGRESEVTLMHVVGPAVGREQEAARMHGEALAVEREQEVARKHLAEPAVGRESEVALTSAEAVSVGRESEVDLIRVEDPLILVEDPEVGRPARSKRKEAERGVVAEYQQQFPGVLTTYCGTHKVVPIRVGAAATEQRATCCAHTAANPERVRLDYPPMNWGPLCERLVQGGHWDKALIDILTSGLVLPIRRKKVGRLWYPNTAHVRKEPELIAQHLAELEEMQFIKRLGKGEASQAGFEAMCVKQGWKDAICSPLLTVPKKRHGKVIPGKLRVLMNASHPKDGDSLNNLMEVNGWLELPRFRDLVRWIRTLQERDPAGAVMGWSIDISKAFHTVPLAPESYRWAVFYFDGTYFYYVSLFMGAKCAPLIFSRISVAVAWAVKRELSAVPHLIAMGSMYLDDLIMFVRRKYAAAVAARVLHLLEHVLGLPINQSKLADDGVPSQRPVMLGILFDLQALTAELTDERREAVVQLAMEWASKEYAAVKELQSWTGVLGAVTLAAPEIAPFLPPLWAILGHWMSKGLAGGDIPPGVHEDMAVVAVLVGRCRGSARLWREPGQRRLTAYTDASTSWGFGGWCVVNKTLLWFGVRWRPEDARVIRIQGNREPGRVWHISALELFGIYMMVVALAHHLVNGAEMCTWLVISSDNKSAVEAVNQGRGRKCRLMNLIARKLVLALQELDSLGGREANSSRDHEVLAEYVRGVDNEGADAPSRGDMGRFWKWTKSEEGERLMGDKLSQLTIVDLSTYVAQVAPTLPSLWEESQQRGDKSRRR